LQRIARVMAAPFKDGNIFAQGLDHGRWSFYMGRFGSGRRVFGGMRSDYAAG
jgi:hypothetical protein